MTKEEEDKAAASIEQNLEDAEGLLPALSPNSDKMLWMALFAITHAVENLDLEDEVNSLRHVMTGFGAYEMARFALHRSRQVEN